MYTTVLVRELIEDGSKLLEELDRQRFPIHAALWHEQTLEYDVFGEAVRTSWKLTIVSPVAGLPGPLEAYKRIRQALTKLKGLSLSIDDILVMNPASRTFDDLRKNIEGVTQMSSSRERFNLEGVMFDDAYVYRWPAE